MEDYYRFKVGGALGVLAIYVGLLGLMVVLLMEEMWLFRVLV